MGKTMQEKEKEEEQEQQQLRQVAVKNPRIDGAMNLTLTLQMKANQKRTLGI